MLRNIGIKRKALYGCVILSIVLLLSGTVSLYEYSKMNSYVSDVISDNINSINTSRELLAVAEQYNIDLMDDLVVANSADSIGKFPGLEDERLIAIFDNLRKKFATPEEQAAADSVVYAYVAYMQVVSEAETIWQKHYDVRRQWYFNRLMPIYLEFRGYMMSLTQICQDKLVANSATLQDGFYRSLMPGVVSVIFGVILALLLDYYLNFFIINPLLKIIKGIKGFRLFGKSYNVKIDSDDEMEQLNTAVKDLIDLNKSYKKQLGR